MTRNIKLILTTWCMALTTVFLFSCDDNMPNPDEKLKGNTVIVYMGAENSLYSLSNLDLDEMRTSRGSIPEDCQVVIYRDAELKPAIFHLTQDGMSTWREFPEEQNSADPATMKSILQDIVKGFPSEKYSLILWSHGSGWIDEASNTRAIIIDNQKNLADDMGPWISISQLSNMLSSLPHMEYIMFDACYMQSVEVAAELYSHTDYIIGSPTEIPGNGAPYNLIMQDLCTADIQGIVDGYASGYTGSSGVLLSAISCKDLPDFCTGTAKYIPKAFPKDNMPKIAGIQIYAPAYGNTDSKQGIMPVPYDMRSAMFRVLSNEDYTAWEAIWRKTILFPTQADRWITKYNTSKFGSFHCTMMDPEHYGGISMNIPNAEYDSKGWNEQFQQTQWYEKANWKQTDW